MTTPRAFGRYQLLDRLGAGGMAEVFRAKSFGVEGFEKTLVIKRILPDLAKNAAFVDLFIREAKLAVRLSHANVVQVFDLGKVDTAGFESETSYFIAMEYVAGLDLATLLARCRKTQTPVPVELAVFVSSEVLKGLDHAHRRRDERLEPLGIVHRDVSPHNILVSWEGEVKLTDFGIAKAKGTIPDALIRGKHAYMSPEQALAGEVQAASDIFSLGVVLYEMLAGKNPFRATVPDETLERVRSGSYRALRDLCPVDGELEAIVHRAMSVDTLSRFDSAAQFHEALLAYMYSSAARFGAGDLAEFIERFRVPSEDADVALLEGPTSIEGDVTGASEDVTDATSIPGVAEPTSIASLELQGRREVSVLALELRADGDIPETSEDYARAALGRYGARVASTAERRIVGVFGLEEVDARDTENAVRCGLVLARALVTDRVDIGVGIDVGAVRVEGNAVLEDDASVKELAAAASTLAQHAKGSVVVSPRAGRALRGMFALETTPDKRGMVVGARRTPQDAAGRFVGRRDELLELGRRLADAARRKLQVVGIVGAHGIGKTRVLHEMRRRISRGSFDVGTFIASCPPRSVPLGGIAAMLRTLCGVRDGDPADRLEAVGHGLRALALVDGEVRAVLMQLGHVTGDRPPASADALAAAVGRMFSSLAEDRLHVFGWDNAQELDDESADVLRVVVENLGAARAMLIFAARPRAEAPFARIRGYCEIRLDALSPDDGLRLLAERIGAADVPEAFVDFVRNRAAGHPLFIEELAREALESRAVVVEGGRVERLDLGGTLAVPRSLRTLLGDRVARLPNRERDLVVAASVLGSPADTGVLAAMLGVSVGVVNAGAEALGPSRLLLRQGPVALAFPTPLLPDVVLAGLDPVSRTNLHRRAAESLERVLGSSADVAGRVAHHLAEAGETSQAALRFATAGLCHLDAQRFDLAALDLSRALELADLVAASPTEVAEWVGGLARAVHYVRSGAAVPAVVRRIEAELERWAASEARTVARIAIDLGQMLGSINRPAEAERLVDAALARSAPWPEMTSAGLVARAELLVRQGDFKRAVESVEQLTRLPAASTAERHRALIIASQGLGSMGRFDEALTSLDEAATLEGADARALRYERSKARALIHAFRNDFAECARACEQAAEEARAAHLDYELALNLHNQGESLMRLGQLPRAYALLQNSLAVAEQCGAERIRNLDRMLLDYLDAKNGSEKSRQLLANRVAYAEENGWTWDAVTGRILVGRLLRIEGDREGARCELSAARRAAETTGNRLALDDCEEEFALLG